MPSVRVNDIELYYEVHGDGSPLLLIPGLGVDVRFFARIIDGLATSCSVVAFDPRGAGRSDKPDIPYSIDGMAEDAAALLDHLDIERATVLGCSMGGRTALMLALDHRGRVDRLVLAASSAYVPTDRLFTRRWLVMDVLSHIPVPKSIDPQPRYAWKRQRQASGGFDCSSRLGEIDVPTLVVHATDDHIVPFALGQRMAREIPGARLVTVSRWTSGPVHVPRRSAGAGGRALPDATRTLNGRVRPSCDSSRSWPTKCHNPTGSSERCGRSRRRGLVHGSSHACSTTSTCSCSR
ncbi:MAG TPA: alpha/beta fold hydrolase [Acidimicrobiales bacterium]|nr:alpha/beta fold hydrolase [Acidimicrobiales bacterium]